MSTENLKTVSGAQLLELNLPPTKFIVKGLIPQKWYAVINLYDTDGKRHEKWKSLNLQRLQADDRIENDSVLQKVRKYQSQRAYRRRNKRVLLRHS